MKATLIFFYIAIGNYTFSNCQDLAEAIKTKYSKKEAIVFNSQYQNILIVPKEAERFNPRMAQILELEITLCDSIRGFDKKFRQYAGYLSNTRDSIMIISVLTPSIIRQNKDSWSREFIYGLGDFYERNQRIFYYNLTSNKFFNP